jgi:predicted DNA-binding transcriptional regulator YafY
MSSLELANELEVTRRTILRDVDAMTEAGLPIVVLQGNQGGIELGFNYRTRLTGLSTDEARALAVILSKPMPELDAIGLSNAGGSARRKLIESLPDRSRHIVKQMQDEMRFEDGFIGELDPRIAAISNAITRKNIVRINARSAEPRAIHPTALVSTGEGWQIIDQLSPETPIPLEKCADINISAKCFA